MSRSMTRRSALVLLGAGFGGTALGFHRWSGSSASQMGSAELFALIQSEFRPDAKSIR